MPILHLSRRPLFPPRKTSFLVESILLCGACGARSNLDTLILNDGGTPSFGGAIAAGGTPSFGGAIAAGGTYSTGGFSPAGGSKSTGGGLAIGGNIPTGGKSGTGGVWCCLSINETCNQGGGRLISSPLTSGPSSCPTGSQCYQIQNCCGCCQPTLCAIATDGTGGAMATGGSPGGVTSSGGTSIVGSSSTGGAQVNGGTMGTGGATATGGIPATGGTLGTGGASALSTLAPDCTTICSIVSGSPGLTCEATTAAECIVACNFYVLPANGATETLIAEYVALMRCTAQRLTVLADYLCASPGSLNTWSYAPTTTACDTQLCAWTCDDTNNGTLLADLNLCGNFGGRCPCC